MGTLDQGFLGGFSGYGRTGRRQQMEEKEHFACPTPKEKG
jgi:hypothetical protein